MYDDEFSDNQDKEVEIVPVQTLDEAGTVFNCVIGDHSVELTFLKFVPLYSKKAPAVGILFSRKVDGAEGWLIQYSAYTGGMHIDQIIPPRAMKPDMTSNLERLVDWGYDPKLRSYGTPTYSPKMSGRGADWGDFIFGAAATVLDTEEGIAFRAYLQTPEAMAEASVGRVERPNFKRILAVNGDHGKTMRLASASVDKEEAYLEIAHKRAAERQLSASTRTEESAFSGLF